MAAVFDNCRDIDTKRLLDWKPIVRRIQDEIDKSSPLGQYADIQQQMLATNDECLPAILLLSEMLARQDAKR